MTIYKAHDHVEAYRAKARARDVNELSGRTGRPDLTLFVSRQIAARLPFRTDDVVVDVGCGDATLLRHIGEKTVDGYRGRLLGVVPTPEEARRVMEALLAAGRMDIQITTGLATRLALPDAYADKVVVNGVLLLLQQEQAVDGALAEIRRITRVGGTVYVGEIPETDEFAGRAYGDSIAEWLAWVWSNQGAAAFLQRLRQVVTGLLGREPFVIAPKKLFFMPPPLFAGKLAAAGFTVRECFRHREIDANGTARDSATRWDYVAVRNP